MKRYVQTRKIVLLTSLVLLSISALAFLQQASALELSLPVTTDGNQLFFRDVNNMANSPATFSLDSSHYKPGQTATLTITDVNANVDLSSAEFLSVVVSTTSDLVGITIFPQETGVSTGVFVGTFTFTSGPSSGDALHIASNDAISVSYEPQPTFAGRFSAQLSGVDVEGFAVMVDFVVTDDEEIASCFVVVTDAVDFQLIDIEFGIPVATSTTVTMSFANAVIGGNVGTLTIFNQIPGGLWLPVTSTINLGAKTITTTGSISTGKFVVGFIDTSCSGSGSGGLVRPGLVLNLLAGIGGGSGGPDHSPPSLFSSNPSIFGSLFAPDPFKPISPTTSPTAPLRINNDGYFPTGYANTIKPEQASTGENVGLTLSFLEASSVQHVALHFVDESSDEMSDTDPMITFDNGNVVKSDPQGILGDEITFSTSRDGTRSTFNFGFSFDQPTKRHLMIAAWDDKRNSANTKVFDAFDVSGQPIPQEQGHLILQELGQYIITQEGVIDIEAQSDMIPQEPVLAFLYSDSTGRLDRHDMTPFHSAVHKEQARAGAIIDNFNLDTNTFVAKDVTKPYDTSKRAPELTWSSVGHQLRDFTKTPDQNKELLKQLCWQEHLKAEKILKSLSKTSNQDD